MKLIHLSDLHIGKYINKFSMTEDQKYIFDKIIEIIRIENPDAVIISGDVYDRSVPTAEAVQIFDELLYKLSKLRTQTFIISGNHDSAERIAFASRIMDAEGIHLSPVYNGKVTPFTLNDEFGEVNIYMLPFVKPINVRRFFEEEETDTYTNAVRTAVKNMNVNTEKRNVLITHQFVTGAKTSDSEEISVGGSDNVDSSVFDCFDYTALGHIHCPQYISKPTVRYCGSPLKYSFSEEKHQKSVTFVELMQKGNVIIREIPLFPLHDMRTVKGKYNDLVSKDFYSGTNTDDYLHIILTDEEEIFNAIGKLRVIYPNIMKLSYDNTRTRSSSAVSAVQEVESKTPLELFSEFYEQQNGRPMSKTQSDYIENLITEIREGSLSDR